MCSENVNNDEISLKIDLNDPSAIFDETRSVQMEAGLMEIVRPLNRSWIHATYFSLYRAIFIRGKCPGECPDTHRKRTSIT